MNFKNVQYFLKYIILMIVVVLVAFGDFEILIIHSNAASASVTYMWPVETSKGTWTRGYFVNDAEMGTHRAIDIAAASGTPVYAIADGKVTCASTESKSASHKCPVCQHTGGGYHVEITHTSGTVSRYAHLSSVSVKKNANIKKGDKIGGVGTTGNSTGNHLHLSIASKTGVSDSLKKDPLKYLTPWADITISDITTTSAKIKATFGAKKMTIDKSGFYIGTSTSNMKKYSENVNADINSRTYKISSSDWYGSLKNGQIYYIKLWASRYGSEYTSPVYAFTAGGDFYGLYDSSASPSTPKLTYSKKEYLLGETSVISWADCGAGVTYTVDIKQGDNNIYNGKPSGTLKHSFVPEVEGKYNITVTAKSANGKTASGSTEIEVLFSLDKGYTVVGNKVYILMDDPVSWSSANTVCTTGECRLAVVDSAEKQSAISELAKLGNLPYYWIGATDSAKEAEWKWVDGTTVSYNNWYPGEPTNSNSNEHWAVVRKEDGKWIDLKNDRVDVGYVVEIDMENFKPTKIADYNGHRYKFYSNTVYWGVANQFAQATGSYLACINDDIELTFIDNNAVGENSQYWLGGLSREIGNAWQWVSGEPFACDDMWHTGEPSNTDNIERAITFYCESGKFIDRATARYNCFITEENIPDDERAVATFSIENKNVTVGKDFSLLISVDSTTDVKSLMLYDFVYDNTAFEIVSGEIINNKAMLKSFDTEDMTAIMAFENNTNINGDLMRINFKAKNLAEGERYTVSCTAIVKYMNDDNIEISAETIVEFATLTAVSDIHVHSEEILTAVAPTCTATGLTEGKKCSVCNEILVAQTTVPATGHTLVAIPGKPATETEIGLTEGEKCSVCGMITKEQEEIPVIIPEHKHDFVEVVTAPTCTEKGYTTYTCSCGDIYVSDETEIIAHDYAESIVKEATCTENGEKSFTCKVCEDTYTDVIAKLSHTEETIPAVAPTCTTTGLTEGKKCSVCGETLVAQTTVPEINHKLEIIPGKPATETETGLTDGEKCSVCGMITKEQEEIPVIIPEHKHDYASVVTAPTCTEKGYTTYTCSCGDTYVSDETEIIAHDYAESIEKEATCKENGEKNFTCKACGDTYTDVIAKLSHTEETILATDPTCTTTGLTEGKKCTVCGEITVAQTEIPALGHTKVSIPAVAPTCTEKGLSEGEKCSVCGKILVAQTEVVALGHSDVVIPTVAPTCTATGLTEGKKCSVCGKTLVAQTEIVALGHTEETIPAKSATCTDSGLTEGKKCSVCNEILLAQKTIAAHGHNPGKWEVVKAAEIGKEGKEQQKCQTCNSVINERVIPALEKPGYSLGDVNNDGKITAADARTVLRASAKLETLDENATIAADVNKDKKITAADARTILRVSAKLESF